ncbi:hypothetical protein L0N33_25310, partial [Roseburia faecis]|nr:hypothetical protein [Roseburia faecis]
MAAQYYGRGELAGVRRSLALALVGALLVSLPFALIYVLAPGSVLGFASQELIGQQAQLGVLAG